jgi:hypothetical protein
VEKEENLTEGHKVHAEFLQIVEGKLGREERYRTVISGMEPRRIAEVMLLPHGRLTHQGIAWCPFCQYGAAYR